MSRALLLMTLASLILSSIAKGENLGLYDGEGNLLDTAITANGARPIVEKILGKLRPGTTVVRNDGFFETAVGNKFYIICQITINPRDKLPIQDAAIVIDKTTFKASDQSVVFHLVNWQRYCDFRTGDANPQPNPLEPHVGDNSGPLAIQPVSSAPAPTATPATGRPAIPTPKARVTAGPLGFRKEEVDEIFMQDHQLTTMQGYGYLDNGAKLVVVGDTQFSNIDFAAWLPDSRPITSKDIQGYLARNGLNLSKFVPVPNVDNWWGTPPTTGYQEYYDPSRKGYHLLVVPALTEPGSDKPIRAVVLSMQTGGGHFWGLLEFLRKEMTLEFLPTRSDNFPSLALGMSRADAPQGNPGVIPQQAVCVMDCQRSGFTANSKSELRNRNGFAAFTAKMYANENDNVQASMRFAATLTFSNEKLVAIEYDNVYQDKYPNLGYGEFTFSDVEKLAQSSHINWNACQEVPSPDKWVAPLRKPFWDQTHGPDPDKSAKAYDIVREYYDPAHSDVHILTGRLGYPGQENYTPQLKRSIIRIENAEGRKIREELDPASRFPSVTGKPVVVAAAKGTPTPLPQAVMDDALQNLMASPASPRTSVSNPKPTSSSTPSGPRQTAVDDALRNLMSDSTSAPAALTTPQPRSTPAAMAVPVAVPEPTPQPAPAPLAMRLEMPTPTPLPKAPKSRWDTNPEPTTEESQEQDLRNAQSEFYSAWYPFSDKERALLKQEEDGWDAYLATIQDPATKAKALHERAKYLRECFAYFKYYKQYQDYRTWCKANGKPVPPALQESTSIAMATPTPVSAELVEQEKAAEQEYRALWNPLTDNQRIALFQEQSQFDLAFQKLRDHGSPADRIRAYQEEIVRMKALIAGMTVPADQATEQKLKEKLTELDSVWSSLPPEQQQRVQPGREGWFAAIKPMAVPDQLRETEKRIIFLKDNLGQFMRAPGVPPSDDDPVLLAQLQEKQAILDTLLNALPDNSRKQFAAGMKVIHDHDAALPITQRIQHLDVEIQSLQRAAEYLKAVK
jgi:hypothetical protein